MAILTDMRKVRLIDGAPTSAHSVEHVSDHRYDLCRHCARNLACKTYLNLKQSERGIVRRCDKFMAPLAFRNKRGTEGVFNTFRLGMAWSRRLRPGMEVGLVDGAGELFGVAKVLSVYCGAVEDMALVFGAENHMLLGCKPTLPGAMLKVLRQSYGNMIFQAHDTATVIFLERQ